MCHGRPSPSLGRGLRGRAEKRAGGDRGGGTHLRPRRVVGLEGAGLARTPVGFETTGREVLAALGAPDSVRVYGSPDLVPYPGTGLPAFWRYDGATFLVGSDSSAVAHYVRFDGTGYALVTGTGEMLGSDLSAEALGDLFPTSWTCRGHSFENADARIDSPEAVAVTVYDTTGTVLGRGRFQATLVTEGGRLTWVRGL